MSGVEGLGDDVGTPTDMAARLRAVLPTGWFPQSPPAPLPSATPVLDGLLAGLGAAWSFCYALLALTAQQARIATATGGFLDLIAIDFFAHALLREVGEGDASFRARILGNLLVRRGTRQAMSDRIAYLTGVRPFITEPRRALDCGVAGHGAAVTAGSGGYCTQGLRYGSDLMAFQYLLLVAAAPAFAPGLSTSRRTSATYLDAGGRLAIAPPMTVRPDYRSGILDGALTEGRSFNLITDSRNWSGLEADAGTAADWSLQDSNDALLASGPVLAVTVEAGASAIGPGLHVAAGGAAACGSAWILIAAGSGLTAAHLALTDTTSGASVLAAADLALTGRWQRLQATLTAEPAAGSTLRMAVGATAGSAQAGTLLTQCWQIEPGSVATSHIPTAGTLGIRDADLIVAMNGGPVGTMPPPAQILSAVAATQPIATNGWTAIVTPILAG